jgi:hemoglobin
MRMPSILLGAVLGVAACGGSKKSDSTTTGVTQPAAGATLYDRLGKLDAIKAVVKDFVEEQVAKDDRINTKFFANADLTRLQQQLVDQICEATGGPCKYTGKSMKEVHTGMHVDDAAFNALVEDLKKSLAKFNVGQAEQDELISALAKMHDDIVEMP